MKLVIHGGCGAHESATTTFYDYHKHLLPIIQKSYVYLQQCNDAIAGALFAACMLEDDPIFNAGTGSKVQNDGQIRMSASIIDSKHNKFAGVINIQNVQNPSVIACRLMKERHSILCGNEAAKFAHQVLNIPCYNPMTESRWQEYLQQKQGQTGTVGVVALDNNGVICAITSTGGVGFESAGRVGDSPTVAGNYASSIMGVSCTGIGEQIINQCVAAKIHTRVLDGMLLEDAVNKSINESENLGDYVGLIAIDQHGNIKTASTKVVQTLYAYHDGVSSKTFYEELQ